MALSKKDFARLIQGKAAQLRDWHFAQAQIAPPPFYSSVDLRDAKFKIAPVDCNVYPAGFNNICPEDQQNAAPTAVRKHIEGFARQRGIKAPQRILILPELHTTNVNYAENLYYLTQIFENAGYETGIGWYSGATEPVRLESATGKKLVAQPIELKGGILSAGSFVPDLVLLNNDFSAGYPTLLDQVVQPILPSHVLGWHTRRKGEHFVHYNRLISEFAQILGVDPWLFQVDTETVEPVNFNEEQGTDRVAEAVTRVLARTAEGYKRHGIKQEPFVFVKNNSGTYGMGIMVARSAEDILEMNRRTKNKMSVGKGKAAIESVIIQEGIPTATIVDRLAAEPVIYLMGCDLIGGFLRTNTERGAEENLNSQGMVFRKLCMSDLRGPYHDECEEDDDHEAPAMELVYGSIARISALAAGLELADHLAGHEGAQFVANPGVAPLGCESPAPARLQIVPTI